MNCSFFKEMMFAGCMVFASIIGAETTVWTGNGTRWNDEASWNNGVPRPGVKAVFASDATIEENFTLNGNLHISVEKGKILNLKGVISGEGNICFGTDYKGDDKGTVNIYGDNTFVGNVTISNGIVKVFSDTGCGDPSTGEVKIYARNPDTELYFKDVVFKKNIYFYNGNDNDVLWQSFLFLQGNNEIGRLQYQNAARFVVENGTTYWTGGAVGTSLFIPKVKANSQLVIKDTPITIMPYQEVGEGVIVFACEGNLIKMSGNYHFETGVRCDVNNAFTDRTALCFGNNNAAVFDLNSTTQSISQVTSLLQYPDPGKITSADDGLLRVVGSANTTVSNIVTGDVSFECALPEGFTATIMNKNNTSTGDLIASSGKLIVLRTAFWNGDFIVKNGGAIELFSKDSFREDAKIFLESGSTLIINDFELPLAEVYLDGEKLAPGCYSADGANSSTPLDVLSGTGTIRVPESVPSAVESVWDAQGSDDNITTKENWVGDELPSFTDGSFFGVFSQNNLNVVLDSDVKMRGMRFEFPDAAVATFDNLNDESISLYDGLISVPAGEANKSKTISINVPLKLQGDTTLNLESYVTMALNESVSSIGNGRIIKNGDGKLIVNGITNNCSIVVSNGVCAVSESEVLEAEIVVNEQVTNRRIELSNTRITGALKYVNAPNDCCVPFICGARDKATTNIIEGPISGQGHCRISVGSLGGSKVYIKGGFAEGNFLIVSGVATNVSEVIIEDTPISGNLNMLYNDSNNATLVFRTQGNYFKSLPWEVANRIRCEVDDIAKSNQIIEFFKNTCGVLDVNGTQQSIRCVQCKNEATIGIVTDDSEEGGGVLKIIGSKNKEEKLLPKFAGKVSLIIDAVNSALTNISENVTSGDLTVLAGEVFFNGPSSWRNVSAVTVNGGKLTVDHSQAFTKKTDLYMDGNGIIDLAPNTVQQMQFLYMPNENGEYKKLALGSYGSPASAAKYKLSCLAGTGIIEIVGDGKGTMVIVK